MEKEGKENGGTWRFDYKVLRQQAIERMRVGDKEPGGKDGVLANCRNGKKTETVRSGHGPFDVEMPHDRDSLSRLKLIAKCQTTLGTGEAHLLPQLIPSTFWRCHWLTGH